MRRFIRAITFAGRRFWFGLSPQHRRAFKGLPLLFLAIAFTALPWHAQLLAAAGLLYFAPLITAAGRDHESINGIAVLNFFLGWTGIGWVIALIWACSAPAVHQFN